ncbi:MAG: WecB/TagA/CpsF family glycosyltransferase [Verrucomicrobiota bacterium]
MEIDLAKEENIINPGKEAATPLFGLNVRNVVMADAVDSIVSGALADRRERTYFINAHCINVAVNEAPYAKALTEVERLYADGSGIAIAARMAASPLVDNVNGTDLFPRLCEVAAERKCPIGLLGGEAGIAAQCAENMRARIPALEVVYVRDGFFSPEETGNVLEEANVSGAKILLVAMGVPKQELFVDQWFEWIRIPQVLAVGGLFDFYSGRRLRAPGFIRAVGMEWMVRLAQEPRRLFGRYILGNPLYLSRVLALRLHGTETLRQHLPNGASRRALTQSEV